MGNQCRTRAIDSLLISSGQLINPVPEALPIKLYRHRRNLDSTILSALTVSVVSAEKQVQIHPENELQAQSIKPFQYLWGVELAILHEKSNLLFF